MPDRIAHIDKSIEKGYYPAAINQIKHSILSENVTKEALETLNIKLLSCLESENFDTHKKIKEIHKIIDNNDLFNKLTNEQKSKLYISLGDNFFDLGDMSESLLAYQERANLGDKEVLKAVIYMSIYMYFSLKTDTISIQDSISHLVDEIEKQENIMQCIPNIKNDLLRFFYSEIVVENPGDNLMMNLYNLEAREIVTKQQLATLAQTFNDVEMQSVSYSVVSELEDEYDILFSEFTDSNVIRAKENMKMRMEGKGVNFSEFGVYIKEFILVGLGMADKYASLNKKISYEKSLFIINFLADYGIKNLSFSERSYLIHYLHEFIMKNSGLSDFYIDGLKNILIKNFDGEIMTTNDLLLVGDMFLKIGEYGNVFENYKVLISLGIDLSEKFKILLEEILMNKEFIRTSDSDLRFGKVNGRQLVEVKKIKMDPEIVISLLLEKLELGQALTQVDYESIEELCKY